MVSIKNCTLAFQLTAGQQRFTTTQFLRIAAHGINTEYRPRRFHAIIMRLRCGGTQTVAALIFQSGRVVLTGVPAPQRAHSIARTVCRRVQHSLGGGGALDANNLRLVNLVGAHTLTHRVAVERMCRDQRLTSAIYDPTIFPALRCKLGSTTATCLVYISGKVIVTGVRTTTHLHSTFDQLFAIVQDYKRE